MLNEQAGDLKEAIKADWVNQRVKDVPKKEANTETHSEKQSDTTNSYNQQFEQSEKLKSGKIRIGFADLWKNSVAVQSVT